MRSRKFWTIAVLAVLLAGTSGGGYWWWGGMPPRTVRLLPEAEGYGYINVGALRAAGGPEKIPELVDLPEYRDFAAAVGLNGARDLDAAALAHHGEIEGAGDARNSLVVTGRLDRNRITEWLRGHAAQVASYRGHDIFFIPVQGRNVRVTFLDDATLAASNALTDEPIHQIIERYHSIWPAKTTLLAEHYREVPVASVAWMIGRYAAQPRRRNGGVVSNSLRRLLAGSVLVGSVRYVGNLELRAQAVTATDEQARRIADDANAFLQIYRSAEVELKPGGSDPDIKAALASLMVEQEGRRVTLRATFPTRLLQKLEAEQQAQTK